MIYFLIEISGLKQLRTVEKDKTRSILNAVYKILGIREYNVLVANNDFILLSLLYKEIHKDRIINSFFECREYLERQEKTIQAFNVVIDYQENQSDEAVYNKLLSELFHTESINALFVSDTVHEMFSAYFDCVQEGYLEKVLERKDYIDPLFSRGGSLHHREEVKQLIIDAIVGFGNS
ncbi:MAG: hypothetical protein JW874_05840, partial [Spirochaetales bacterium]|nr:hypothetical protein [Spirochaetales bacterium]